MFSHFLSRTAAHVAMVAMLPLLGAAQPVFEVDAEPVVRQGHLEVDFYVRRTGAANFSLNNSNFTLSYASTGLDLANAVVDHAADGVWDDQTDSRGYGNLELGQRDNRLTLNIRAYAQLQQTLAASGGPGTGRGLSTTRERIGRIRIPITDPTAAAQLAWETNYMAVTDWAMTNRTPQGRYNLSRTTLYLCEAPGRPTLAAPATAVCANGTEVLSSNFTGTHVWYRDGVEISGQTSPTLPIMAAGSYTARVVSGTCASDVSQAVAVTVLEVRAPFIAQVGASLVLEADGKTGDLQWYRDGAPVSGATASSYTPKANGRYHLTRSSLCGSMPSNFIEFQYEPGLQADTAYASVYPNPYVDNTTLTYRTSQTGPVTIQVATVSGVVVKQLVNQVQLAGSYSLPFSARAQGLAAGTYLLRIQAGSLDKTFKLVESK